MPSRTPCHPVRSVAQPLRQPPRSCSRWIRSAMVIVCLAMTAQVVLASSISTGDSSNTSDAIAYGLTASGAPDTTFGEGLGGIVVDMEPDGPGVEADRVTSLIGYRAHPFVVGSGEYNAPDTDFSVARLTSSLIFANRFDDGSSWW
jgi:hypothetical protein